jgi:hypothetical protein
MSINSIIQGQGLCSQSQTLFYIPAAEEICLTDRHKEASRLKDHTSDYVSGDTIDGVIKSLVKYKAVLNAPVYKIEGK